MESIPRCRHWPRVWERTRSRFHGYVRNSKRLPSSVDEASAAVEKNPQSAGKPLLHGLKLTRTVIGRIEASSLSAC